MDLHLLTNIVAPQTYYFTGTKYRKLVRPECVTCPFVFSFGHIDLIVAIFIVGQEHYVWCFTDLIHNVHNKEFGSLLDKFVRQVVLYGAINLDPYLLKRLLRLGLLKLKGMMEIVLSHNIHNVEWYFHKLTTTITVEFDIKQFKTTAHTLALIDQRGWRPQFHPFFNKWTTSMVSTISDLNKDPQSLFYKLPLELIHIIFGYIAVLK